MSYIDCYLAPVPRANRADYEALAKLSAQVVMEYGALRVFECWLDESGPDASTYHGVGAAGDDAGYGDFRRVAGAGDGETVVMSCIEWPDRDARDAGMAKVVRDPRMQFEHHAPAFDGKRLVAGGFRPMVLAVRGMHSPAESNPGRE